MNKKFLTTEEIQNFYGIDEDVVNEFVTSGDLKALPDRGVMKYRREDLDALIRSGRLHPTKVLPEVGEDAVGSDLDFPIQGGGNEQIDFLELDDEALAQPVAAQDSSIDAPPSDPGDGTSSSDVVVLEPAAGMGSDSDIHLRSDTPKPALGEAATMDDQTVIAPGSDHVLEEIEEEGITLSAADSGITLEKPDSGITLHKPDSGITLQKPDSGITLASDSGITLAHDSGISLEKGGKKPKQAAVTEPMDIVVEEDEPFRFVDEESAEQIPVLRADVTEDDIPGLFDEPDPTAILNVASEHQTPSFSQTVETGVAVDDLEVSDHLEAALSDEDAEVLEDEDVLEASDEIFGEEGEEGEAVAGEGDEEYLAAAPGKAKPTGPTWGMLANISIIAASVLVALNALLIFEGMRTMWNGATDSSVASPLITSISGLM